MTESSAPKFTGTRLAACLVAAGLLFAGPAVAQTRLPPPATPASAEVRQDRLEELETQLREAEARNEDLQRQLMEAQREIRRLNGMVSELAGVNQSLSDGRAADGAAAPAPATPPAGSGGSADNAPVTLNEAQRAATGTLGSIPAAAAAPAPATAAAPTLDAGAAYTQARELLVAGRYAEAEAAFGDFLQNYPQAETAADARFWFAFTLLARNNYQDAAANFVQYLQETPQGARAPEAQVRLGMALVGMERTREGCQAFSSLTRRYPNAPRNVRDLATREATAARCSA